MIKNGESSSILFDNIKKNDSLVQLKIDNKQLLKQIKDMALKDTKIKANCMAIVFQLADYIKKTGLPYWDTFATDLMDVARVTTKGSITYLLKKLERAGYIVIGKVKCLDSKHYHYRLSFSSDLIVRVRKIITGIVDNAVNKLAKNKSTGRPSFKANEFKESKHYIYNINQNKSFVRNELINQNELQKGDVMNQPKNTTTQDMLKIYNEIAKQDVIMDAEIGKFMYSAFKDKFKSLEKWKEYLMTKVKGTVKYGRAFLFYLLLFTTINSAMAMQQEQHRLGEKHVTFQVVRKDSDYNKMSVQSYIEESNDENQQRKEIKQILNKTIDNLQANCSTRKKNNFVYGNNSKLSNSELKQKVITTIKIFKDGDKVNALNYWNNNIYQNMDKELLRINRYVDDKDITPEDIKDASIWLNVNFIEILNRED